MIHSVIVVGQALTITPVVGGPEFRAPWVASSGWGRFVQTPVGFELACRTGEIAFRTLRLNVPFRKDLSASSGGKSIPAAVASKDGLTVLTFRRPVKLAAGESLAIE